MPAGQCCQGGAVVQVEQKVLCAHECALPPSVGASVSVDELSHLAARKASVTHELQMLMKSSGAWVHHLMELKITLAAIECEIIFTIMCASWMNPLA